MANEQKVLWLKVGVVLVPDQDLKVWPNRVSAGFSPALPTPPSMRVRTRRLK